MVKQNGENLIMRRILSVLLENESGALSRVIGLFSQRGYNIESLTVAPTDDPTLSRMTIQTVGDEKVLEQIEKQLKEEYEPVFGKDLLYKQRLNKFDSFCQENADLSLEEALTQYRALSGSKLLKK